MRGLISFLAAVSLIMLPAPSARAGGAFLAFSRSAAGPGADVTVTIQLATPPVEGTFHFMILEDGIDNPNNFTVVDPIPFDATGRAQFTFTVPDVAPAVYLPSYGCVNTGNTDACDSPDNPSFSDLFVQFEVTRTQPDQGRFKEVRFRLTLAGPVPATDGFGIRRRCADAECFSEDIYIFCLPPDGRHAYDRCRAGTYEFTHLIEAGRRIEYSIVRWVNPSVPLTAEPEEYLHGSFIVQGPQTISLGYAYPDAGTGLPDTALPAP